MSLRSVLPRVKTGLEVGGGGDSFLGRGKKVAELLSCPYLLSFRPPPARPLAAHIGLLPGAGKGTETRKAVLNLIQWQPSFTGFVSLPAMERYERRREGGKSKKERTHKKKCCGRNGPFRSSHSFPATKKGGNGKGETSAASSALASPEDVGLGNFLFFFLVCVCLFVGSLFLGAPRFARELRTPNRVCCSTGGVG